MFFKSIVTTANCNVKNFFTRTTFYYRAFNINNFALKGDKNKDILRHFLYNYCS